MAFALARQAVAGPSILRTALPALSLPALALPTLRLPSLNDILEWGITLAVPKSKISHSRKSMRSAHKGIKNKTSESAESARSAGELVWVWWFVEARVSRLLSRRFDERR